MVIVPFCAPAVPAESGTLVPLVDAPVSSKPQRATKVASAGFRTFNVERIWFAVRATFQMRGSSSLPAKNPDGTPVELSAVASAACWMLSFRTGWPTKSSASSTPFRYRRHVPVPCAVVPSYVAAAWYQMPSWICVVPTIG